MNRADRITGIVTLMLSVYMIISAIGMNYWHDTTPGPGFMPFWTGIAIGLTSIYLIAKTFIKPSAEKSPFKKEEIRAMGVILGGVVAAVLISYVLGFMIAICLMIGFMMRFLGTTRWRTIFLVSVISTIALYFTFVVALGVPMPDSLIGL